MWQKVWRMGLLIGLTLWTAACAAKQTLPPQPKMPSFAGEARVAPDVVESAPLGGMPEAPMAQEKVAAPEGQQAGERLVIRTAEMSITVDDPQATVQALTRMATEMGGYVVNVEMYTLAIGDGQERLEATVTFRVPAERYDEALTRVETLAVRVEQRVEHGQDVTEEYTDLEARLRNLRVAEQQLQELMDQATKVEDVLRVYNELVRIREQIEVLEGRMRYLEQSAALSAITVHVRQRKAAQPVSSGGWEPQGVLKEALQALVRTLQGIGTLVIWLAVYVLPLVLLVGVVLGLPAYYLVWRPWRRRREKQDEA